MSDLQNTLIKLVQLFDRLQTPYAIMGGWAVRHYGLPRPTFDVDFTLTIDRNRLGHLYGAAMADGFTVSEPYRKVRNDYGQAVGKHLKKAGIAGEMKKFDLKTPAGKQSLDDGLNAAGEEKAPDGRKFAEIIQGGKLP